MRHPCQMRCHLDAVVIASMAIGVVVGGATILAGCDASRSPSVGATPAQTPPIPSQSPPQTPPAPAATPAAPIAAEARPVHDGRTFRPSVNGFHFVNSFDGSAAPPALREAKGGLLGLIKGATESSVGDRFGLCGGMSASAADYFNAGRTPPTTRDVPAEGSTLRDYLFARQVDSIGAMGLMAAKFVERMALPDLSTRVNGQWTDSAAARTTPELEPIVTRLDRGDLVPLGLVHVSVGNGGAIWENHQVLAYAYERSAGNLTLHVYDPNAPLDDGAVVRLVREGEADAPEQWRGALEYGHQADGRMRRRPVRTLFAMPYVAKAPPTQ